MLSDNLKTTVKTLSTINKYTTDNCKFIMSEPAFFGNKMLFVVSAVLCSWLLKKITSGFSWLPPPENSSRYYVLQTWHQAFLHPSSSDKITSRVLTASLNN